MSLHVNNTMTGYAFSCCSVSFKFGLVGGITGTGTCVKCYKMHLSAGLGKIFDTSFHILSYLVRIIFLVFHIMQFVHLANKLNCFYISFFSD